MINNDELITVVDSRNNIVRLEPKKTFRRDLTYHRTSALLLFNSKRELLLQKRSKKKKWFPGLYDFSASGTVTDESYEKCMKRETKEELGILPKVKRLFMITPADDGGRAFQVVFSAHWDGEIDFDREEADQAVWIDFDIVQRNIQNRPDKYTPQLAAAIKKYLELKNNGT